MRIFLLFILLGTFMQGCHEESHGFEVYFCTTSSQGQKHYLYINNVQRGVLPFTRNVPAAEDAALDENTLYAALPSGKHSVEVKDEKGNIVFSETLRVRRKSGSSSISSTVKDPGCDTRVKIFDDQLVVEIIY